MNVKFNFLFPVSTRSSSFAVNADISSATRGYAKAAANAATLIDAALATDTASGAIASFSDGAEGLAVKGLTLNVEPSQNLHGYANPWPAGGGKNLLENTQTTIEKQGLKYTVNSDGTVTVTGTASANSYLAISVNKSFAANVIVNGVPTPVNSNVYIQTVAGGTNYNDTNGNGQTIPANKTITEVRLRVNNGTALGTTGVTFKPMIRLASDSDATFVPYSNVCPISGHTGVTVYVSPTIDPDDATTYPITFPDAAGTVYGGTVNVTTGKLYVDRVLITRNTANMNNGESYPGWRGGIGLSGYGFSGNGTINPAKMNVGTSYSYNTENDVIYLSTATYGKTQTEWQALAIDVQMIIPLATPIEYDLTPEQITTLKGSNNIWQDSGTIAEVEYYCDTKLYVQKMIAAALNA